MPRPKKKFKSLDDDNDVTNILEVVENIDVDIDDDEIILAPDDIPSDDVFLDEKEYVSVSGDNISITSIRSNPPPPKLWSDGVKTKFTIGDLVSFKYNPEYIYKIVGPCTIPNTYIIKLSGTDGTRCNIPEDKIKKAKPGATWVDYWDTIIDPYRDWKRKKEQQEALRATAQEPPYKKKNKK
jgi:hypothetical protein